MSLPRIDRRPILKYLKKHPDVDSPTLGKKFGIGQSTANKIMTQLGYNHARRARTLDPKEQASLLAFIANNPRLSYRKVALATGLAYNLVRKQGILKFGPRRRGVKAGHTMYALPEFKPLLDFMRANPNVVYDAVAAKFNMHWRQINQVAKLFGLQCGRGQRKGARKPFFSAEARAAISAAAKARWAAKSPAARARVTANLAACRAQAHKNRQKAKNAS